MSDSAQSLPETSTRSNALWLALSVLAHGAILAWLLLLVPAAEIAVLEKGSETHSSAAVNASPERIQQVAEQIELTQAEEVRAKVEELLSTQQSLGELQAQTQTEFSAIAQEMAQAAPQKASDALAVAVEAQARAEQAETEAKAAIEAMNQARQTEAATPEEKAAKESQIAADQMRAAEAQARAKAAQTEATTAQVSAAQQMNFQGGLDEAKAAQTRAADAQAEANSKQDVATELRSSLNGLQKQATRTADNLARVEKSVDQGSQRIADKEKAIAGLEENVKQQQERLDQAKAAGNDKEAAKAQKTLEPIATRLGNAKKDLQKMQEKQQTESAKVEPARVEAQKAAEQLRETPGKLEAAQSAALQAQQTARTVQSQAQSEVAKAFASAPAASAAASAEVVQAAPPTSLEDLNLAELYAMAVATEKNIAEQFQSIRAAQVAVQKQIPLSEASKYVQMALPIRGEPPPNAASAKTAEELAAQNAAIEKALKELESMLALTRGMAWQARSTSAGGEGVTVSMEAMKAQAAQEQELAALAAENENQLAVDLSELMKQMSGGVHTGGQGSQAGGSQGSGVGFGPTGLPGSNQAGGPAGVPAFPSAGAVINSLPGRKIHGGDYSEGAKWMFIDTWWVIGPFPNPGRRNIEYRFAPESRVDLDATYPVEGGVLRWRFVQNSEAKVRPPDERSYSIYYAYTELWFDEERDLWIAMGSDDFSKIWINDMQVWASGMQHKAWKPNEGYRKVHFKKGLNRVLMRVENGQHVCNFSFMLNTQSKPE
jgi:hypothetical protein